MRVAIGQFSELTDERLTFAEQLGVSGVQLNTPAIPSEKGYWEYSHLKSLKDKAEDRGLRLEALENVPIHFYDKVMLGLPDCDQQIENYQKTIANMGKAGIPILGYHWMPNGVWRTPPVSGRGGAAVTAFDADLIDVQPLTAGVRKLDMLKGSTISHSEMWDNYIRFMEAVVPVAEESGVRLALHPDDPPIPMLGGVARLFYEPAGFQQALDAVPSPNSGLDFCMGCFSEMGPGVVESIRHFGRMDKIFYVHFRDVQGHVPCFQECFIGEGNVDVIDAMRTLKEVGFSGFIIDDHVPAMVSDSNYSGRAHATGYITALVDAVMKLC